jgi:hypothetical protein
VRDPVKGDAILYGGGATHGLRAASPVPDGQTGKPDNTRAVDRHAVVVGVGGKVPLRGPPAGGRRRVRVARPGGGGAD